MAITKGQAASWIAHWQQQAGGKRPFFAQLLLLILINGIVGYNAITHHPLIGYDAHDHIAYLLTMSEGHFPTPLGILPNSDPRKVHRADGLPIRIEDSWFDLLRGESSEFFSPPLPYALPALLLRLNWLTIWHTLRFGLLLNVLLSLGSTFTLVALTRQLYPQRPWLPAATLALFGLLPVYYKTFAFIRGEPYVFFFGLLLTLMVVRQQRAQTSSVRQAVALGVLLGLGILSRQWAFFFFPVVGAGYLLLWWQQVRSRPTQGWRGYLRPVLWHGVLTAVIAILVGGWFYLYLYDRYGSLTAFNREPDETFGLTNQPLDFYFGSGEGLLFTDPVRPNFSNHLLPKFYSEMWGDHESYFLVMGWNGIKEKYYPGFMLLNKLEKPQLPEGFVTNRAEMGAFLGWVNRLALLPTAVFLAGMAWTTAVNLRWLWRKLPAPAPAALFPWLAVVTSVAGYLWFLIQYPNPERGDTIKATYLLHIFPFVALLTAVWLTHLPHRRLVWLLWAALAAVALLISPTFFTHYPV